MSGRVVWGWPRWLRGLVAARPGELGWQPASRPLARRGTWQIHLIWPSAWIFHLHRSIFSSDHGGECVGLPDTTVIQGDSVIHSVHASTHNHRWLQSSWKFTRHHESLPPWNSLQEGVRRWQSIAPIVVASRGSWLRVCLMSTTRR